MDTADLIAANGKRWASMRVHVDASVVAHRLVTAKARYQTVEKTTNVPWAVIAVIHEREASQNWMCSLAQGDRWDKVSVNVPKGRGPFASWEAAALDALAKCAPFAATWHDWSIGGALALLEEYNGMGYAHKGRPSPYIWAGTDQYTSGKYVADGVYDPSAVDHQLGCAAMLSAMMAIDPSITWWKVGVASPVNQTPPLAPSMSPLNAPLSKPPEAPIGILSAIFALLAKIFTRK